MAKLYANRLEEKIGKFISMMFAIFFVFIIALLAIRITKGIDFSDEAYYAFFVADWLNTGVRSSTLITLHQTAALIVYPFVYLYYRSTGSMDALFLFLRALFLVGNVLAAISWMILFAKLRFRHIRWVGGLIILSFIPFGLPAPSYNTLGSQSLTIALAMAGCLMLVNERAFLQQIFFAFFSILAFTVATIAYPPLVLVIPLFIFLTACLGFKNNRTAWSYNAALLSGLFLGWCCVIYTLSWEKLYQSILFLSAVNEPLNYINKFNFIAQLFMQNKIFSLLCFLAGLIGLFRQYFRTHILMAAISALTISLFFIPPVLFVRAHDIITILTLTGLSFLFNLKKRVPQTERIIALIYATSLFAALITGLTAFHSIFNFCIGALPAACLAVFPLPERTSNSSIFNFAPGMLVIYMLLTTSLFYYYGELPNQLIRKQVKTGFFAGISASQDDINLLEMVDKELTPLLTKDKTVAIFSRIPGIILGTQARLEMPFVYPLIPTINARGLVATQAFYSNPIHHPQIVLIYHDPYFAPINPLQIDFDKRYQLSNHLKTPRGEIDVYTERLL